MTTQTTTSTGGNGLAKTGLNLAVLAAVGRVVVPIAVQQTIDTGVLAGGGPDVRRVVTLVVAAAFCLVVAGLCSALVNIRLFRSTEAGLATLRVRGRTLTRGPSSCKRAPFG